MSEQDRKLITLVDIDIDFCARTYGQAPCQAQLGQTGDRKCFNTFPTCQDPANFAGFPKRLRFATNADYLPASYGAIPFLQKVSSSPMQLNPGDDLGKRASAKMTFSDHPYHDVGLDNYQAERISGAAQQSGEGYDPAKRGTFWGKFRARNAESFLGRDLIIRRGELGQNPDDMLRQQYIIESIQGPNDSGQFQITAKDILKLADGDRAQAPRASAGVLDADLLSYQNSFTLSPVGIGDLEYASSGYLAIGQEVVEYTRSGDDVTITLRGALNTIIDDHDEGDTVQQVLTLESMRIDEIVYELLTEYGNISGIYINQAQWEAEALAHMPLLYTAHITEPVGVRDLLNELTQQVGFNIWWDDVNLRIPMLALKQPPINSPSISERTIIAGSMNVQEQPDKRVSDVWINYGIIDPTQREDDANNYRNTLVRVAASSRRANGGQPAIRYIFSRWINQFNRAAAEDVSKKLIQRFGKPPRYASFDLPLSQFFNINIGDVRRISHRLIQAPDGGYSRRFWQIVSKDRKEDRVSVAAQEFGLVPFDPDDPDSPERPIFIDNDVVGLNFPGEPPQTLREVWEAIWGPPVGGELVTVTIAEGVLVGGANSNFAGIEVGDWPETVDIVIVNRGSILGYAGRGGTGGPVYETGAGINGEDGGPAIRTNRPITIDNDEGIIGAGGGGGGGGGGISTVVVAGIVPSRGAGGGGGGGAGYAGQTGGDGGDANFSYLSGDAPPQSAFGEAGTTGTDTAAGDGGDGGTESQGGSSADGGNGGNGGALGQPGSDGTAASGTGDTLYQSAAGSGGEAGDAIDGDSFVSFTYEGTIIGDRVG